MGWIKKGKEGIRLKDRFFAKEKNFLKMLSDQAAKTLEGIEALGIFVENQNQKTMSEK